MARARTRAPSAANRGASRRRGSGTAPGRPGRLRRTGVGGRKGVAVKLRPGPQDRDPKFQQALAKLNQSAKGAKKHGPAAKKAEQAQKAALPPPNEKVAEARANQVGDMSQAKTGKPQSGSFLSMLRAEIAKAMPKKVEDGKDYMKGDDRQQLKNAMTGNVAEQKEQSTAELQHATDAPPDTASVPGKEVAALPNEPPPPAPAPVNAGQAMPGPKPESEVSLEGGKKSTEQLMKDHELSDTQMQKANDPRFSNVTAAKARANQYADTAPTKFRADEQRNITQSATLAAGEENRSLQGMRRVQGGTTAGVRARQMTAKQKDEARRKEVADHIQGIFTKTKAAVDKKLASLEGDVTSLFDKGADDAVQKMKDYVEQRFDDRYSGPIGWGAYVKDKLLPLPPGVKAWFNQAHQQFLANLDALIERVANLVEMRLKEAKAEIDKGQAEIRKYVEGLPKDLQAVGQAAEKEVNSQFDELRQGVDEKKNDLAQKLAQKYKDAHEKGAAALQAMKDAHKSLYEKVKDAIEEVVKVLREFRSKVVAMLKKGKDTIDLIISDPIGFLKNLLGAIKKGLSQFVANIWTHLKAGFMKWLFGSLADAGVEMPADFSLGSILKLVLQVLGLTYARIRPKIAKVIGERNMTLIEKAFELIKALWEGGPAALWEKIKEFLGDLKQMVMDAIQDWLITTIIKAAVAKMVTMFNPVGAIIQAIITIYNTIMFLIERIRQIMEFVEAVINSVHKIATGAIGDAANWIEKALGRTIPIIISFLARLLGLGGISDKIVAIIKKIQAKVDAAVDKLIAKIVGGIGKLFGAAKRKVGEIVEWWKAKKKFTADDGEEHALFFSGKGKTARLMIASQEKTYAAFIAGVKVPAGNKKLADAKAAALKIALEIDGLKNKDANTGVQSESIVDKLNQLAEYTRILAGGSGIVPPSVITYGGLGPDHRGTEMNAEILSTENLKGTRPTDSPKIWTNANRRKKLYVQGHLLNQRLGGPGRAYNLTPISRSANAAHERVAESAVKDLVSAGAVLRYKVVAKYGKHKSLNPLIVRLHSEISTLEKQGKTKNKAKIDALDATIDSIQYEQSNLCLSFKITYNKLKKKGSSWVIDGSAKSATIENTLPEG